MLFRHFSRNNWRDLNNKPLINQLILDCQKNDGQAQRKLYEMFSAVLFSVCQRYAENPDDAKDYFQEGFILIFQNIKKFRFEGSFEGWMKRIMVNNCLEKLRNKQTIYYDDIENLTIDLEDNLEDEYAEMPYDLLLNAVQQLPNQYRKVFNLYVFEEMKHQEIAELLGISVNTSKSNLSRARVILKEKLIGMNNHINK